jgi:hypothetical protein
MRIGGLAAGMLVVGLLIGLAGTAVARDVDTDTEWAALMADHMADQDMTQMMSMMGGSMMGGAGGAMMGGASGSVMGGSMGPEMMGPGAPAMPGASGMPGNSGMPGGQHEQHHPKASPEAAK